jgi:hypothetical protein
MMIVPGGAFMPKRIGGWQPLFGPTYFNIFRNLTWTGTLYSATGSYPSLDLKAGAIPINATKARFTFDVVITPGNGTLQGPWMYSPSFSHWPMPSGYSPSSTNLGVITEITLGAWKTSAHVEFFTFDSIDGSNRIPQPVHDSLSIKNFEVYIP